MPDSGASRRSLGNRPLVAARGSPAYVDGLLSAPGACMVEPTDVVVPILRTIQADIAGVKRDVADLKGDVADLKGDVAGLKGDVAELKRDVANLKGDVADLKGDVAEVKRDVAEVKRDLAEVKRDLGGKIDTLSRRMDHFEDGPQAAR